MLLSIFVFWCKLKTKKETLFFFKQFLSKRALYFFTGYGLLIFTCEDTADGPLLPKIPSQAREAVVSKPPRALQCPAWGDMPARGTQTCASCVSRGFWLLDLEVHPLHHHPISTVHFFNELNYKTVYNIWATSDELTM